MIAFVRENRSLTLITPLGTNERRLTARLTIPSFRGARTVSALSSPTGFRNGGPLAVFTVDVATGETTAGDHSGRVAARRRDRGNLSRTDGKLRLHGRMARPLQPFAFRLTVASRDWSRSPSTPPSAASRGLRTHAALCFRPDGADRRCFGRLRVQVAARS